MDDNTTVTVTSKGQLVIPARFRRELGIRKGTQVSITVNNGQLILQPVVMRRNPSHRPGREFIRSLHGSLKGKPDLLALFFEDRRRERERENLRP